MVLNLASAYERIAHHRGDSLALHCGGISRTWAELDDRAARLASVLGAVGVGPGDNVACALYNSNEYIEVEYAAFKVRAAPCNVNYRYVESELAYLIDNSDAKAVFFDSSLAERFGNVRQDLPDVRLWIQVGGDTRPDWAISYESLIADNDPAPSINREPSDLWILYTGGTTGNPKGVMWPHQNLVTISRRYYERLGHEPPSTLDDVAPAAEAIANNGGTMRQLAASPLMHGTAGITALAVLLSGGSIVSLSAGSFDANELWNTVEQQRCTFITIVGDVFATPMVEALDAAAESGKPVDLTSLTGILSSGVMWSQPIKDRLLAHAGAAESDLTLIDSLGASEGVGFGGTESSVADPGTATAKFTLGPFAAVFTEDGRRVKPGSGERGFLAVGGPIPLGYYGDPEKTAQTFRTFEGQRWSVPGDWATVESDETITLLGRGSVSINTGGEKVYPEEVEEALKLLDDVVDANVVGVPDPRWGSVVVAVVESTTNATSTDKELVDSLRTLLAGYKLPKHIVRVDKVFRSPNGKSDFKWAVKTAREALGIPDS